MQGAIDPVLEGSITVAVGGVEVHVSLKIVTQVGRPNSTETLQWNVMEKSLQK